MGISQDGRPLPGPLLHRMEGESKELDAVWNNSSVRVGPLHQVAQFLPFGPQVLRVMAVGFDADGDLLDDLESVTFEANNFFRVVGEEADGFEAEVGEDLGTQAVFAPAMG